MAQGEIERGPGKPAAVSNKGNDVSADNPLADLFQKNPIMAVQGHVSVAVIHDEE